MSNKTEDIDAFLAVVRSKMLESRMWDQRVICGTTQTDAGWHRNDSATICIELNGGHGRQGGKQLSDQAMSFIDARDATVHDIGEPVTVGETAPISMGTKGE